MIANDPKTEALLNVLQRRCSAADDESLMQELGKVIASRRPAIQPVIVNNSEVSHAIDGMTLLVSDLQDGLARYAAGVEELAKDDGALAAAIDRQTQALTRFMSDLKALLKPRERRVVKDAKGEIIGWKEVNT